MAATFDGLVREFGYTHQACAWTDAHAQTTRFEVLAAVTGLSSRSILDVGCGLGDLARYLLDSGDDHIAERYTGIDISAEMITRAQARSPHLDLRRANVTGDWPGQFDVVLGSGIFAFLPPDRFDLMLVVIEAMFSRARHAVAFNSLSDWSPTRDPGELQADPEKTLHYCRKITPRIVLRHDYDSHDFTIYLYRQS